MTDAIELARENGRVLDVEAQSYLGLINFQVQNETDNQLAAETLRHVKERLVFVEAERKKISVPLNAALKAVNDLFRPARQKLEECERQLKQKIAGYLTARDAANRAALAAAAAAPSPELAGDALAAIAPAAPPDGVSVRYVWKFEVVDGDNVPLELWSPDPEKIGNWIRQHYDKLVEGEQVIPGVRLFKESIVASRKLL